MKRCISLAVVFASTLALAQTPQPIVETVETIQSRGSHTQTFLLLKVDKPVATLLLYSGSKGYVGIFPNGSAQFDQFYVYRARRMLAQQGFNVLLLDAPSEWGSSGLWEKQRTPEFISHNAAVLAHARKVANVPVFLLGHSSGGITAAAVATQLKDKGADGMILVSPWMPTKEKWPIPSFVYSSDFGIASWQDLKAVNGPRLLVHHLDDDCNFSLPSHIPSLKAAFGSDIPLDVIGISGGVSPSGNPCYPTGRNNFNGLEREVSEAIGGWIKNQLNKGSQALAKPT